MPPVTPSVHGWEVSREWSWEEHAKPWVGGMVTSISVPYATPGVSSV